MNTTFDLQNLLRDNIRKLVPYASARDEFKGKAEIYLDANENSFGSPVDRDYNRYPDPLQLQLKEKISHVKGVPVENIFLGNGSDEVIDLLYRAFCRPGTDSVILTPPTYGMYEVSANINDVAVKKAPLDANYQLDIEAISELADEKTKLIFLCSPNNPTGNSIDREDIEIILNNFEGIVVIDEAYINYARQKTFIAELMEYPNLVVMQTFSKAWGMASLRVGMAFASAEIIDVLNRIKPPYNINGASQQLVLEALDQVEIVNKQIRETVGERERLTKALQALKMVQQVFPSDANFILVRVENAKETYDHLVAQGIIVRDRSRVSQCEGCLRITVGTPAENDKLLEVLNTIQ